MGQNSGLFLNEKLYWVFTPRHKTCIKSGYIFECELIYCIFSRRMVTYTVHRVRAGSTTWHDERKHRPPNGICYLNGTLYGQRYVDSPGSCGSNGSCYSRRLMPVVSTISYGWTVWGVLIWRTGVPKHLAMQCIILADRPNVFRHDPIVVA